VRSGVRPTASAQGTSATYANGQASIGGNAALSSATDPNAATGTTHHRHRPRRPSGAALGPRWSSGGALAVSVDVKEDSCGSVGIGPARAGLADTLFTRAAPPVNR
jgi:hypothetical protein